MTSCHNYDDTFSFHQNTPRSCHTCTGESETVKIAINDGTPFVTQMFETSAIIPNWYKSEGIYSPLPPHFTCDEKYKKSPSIHVPTTYNANVSVDISNSPLGSMVGSR